MPDTNNAASVPKKQEEYDAGHVPITEEFDSAKHTLPSAAPVLVAFVILSIIAGVLAFILRSKPLASGSIDSVYAVEQNSHASTFVVINLNFKNDTKKPLTIQGLRAELATDSGTWPDDAAPAVDYPRYIQAYPELGNYVKEPLRIGNKIQPAETVSGSVLVAFPTTKANVEKRRSLAVDVSFKDRPTVTFKK